MPEINILRYFPEISAEQAEKINSLNEIYSAWNSKINVISRKDIDNFMIHHVLHSLAIAKFFSFPSGSKILDVGTGGGFPGIPLSILFPDSEFSLLDSIGKKIKVVASVAGELGLKNVIPLNKRVEDEKGSYNFITGRAVAEFNSFVRLTLKNVKSLKNNNNESGIICLKGGDLEKELEMYRSRIRVWNISDLFEEPFFETKKVVYLPI
ncbi:MAG TPA: 16S rRNA (guanine(527)-N(7))-methyltransferase RsmG [Bacteroidales bacterium]|nr:16S rRNA (guanine(527)-N(7))-methyltransferase RsmG [Bacteroidales bacterium]